MSRGEQKPRVATDRYISPARASQIMHWALGHGYSRKSVVRLLEQGALQGHQMKPRGRWWILASSVNEYINRLFPDGELPLGARDATGAREYRA